MPYRSYFLALLGINLLILLSVGVFVIARREVFAQLFRRVKQGPIERWEVERRKYTLYDRNMKPGSIIMFGNSLTEQGEWAELLGDSRVVNRGISGETVDRMLKRVPDFRHDHIMQVMVMAGINDLLYHQRPLQEVEANYDSLLAGLTQKGIAVTILSTLPTTFDAIVNDRVVELNRHLQQRAAQSGGRIYYLDLWPVLADQGKLRREMTFDGLHLNEKGYAAWAEAMKGYLPPPVPLGPPSSMPVE